MDEARRFLRYVIPGLSFVVQLVLLLCELIPDWTFPTLKYLLSSDRGIGIALAALLGTGGLGFLFSMFHHELLWGGPRWVAGPIDHSDLIEWLRQRDLLLLLDARSGVALDALDETKPDRFQSWAIVTALWHERIQPSRGMSRKIKSANPRIDSLVNTMHSMGTSRVASVAAILMTSWIFYYGSKTSAELPSVACTILTVATAVILVLVHHAGYWRTGLVARRVIEQVMTDALAEEIKSAPVWTYVDTEPSPNRKAG
jgi:hypothetical protein